MKIPRPATGLGATAALIVALLACGAGPAWSATFSVGAGCTHANLPTAVFAAFLSPEDDLIKVTQPLTNQSVVVQDFDQAVRGSVTIRGGYTSCGDTTSSGRTAIDGIASEPVIRVDTSAQPSSTAILENLELRGAARGAAVFAGGHLTLNNVLVTDNRDGGVTVDSGTLVTAANCEIRENGLWPGEPAPTSGGGIVCSNGGALGLSGDIHNNRAEVGGGVALFGGCEAQLWPGTWITQNTALSNGGGLYLAAGSTAVGNGNGGDLRLWGNSAGFGGAVYADGAGVVVFLQDTSFASNEASVDGAAIAALNGATVSLTPSVGCPVGFFSCNEIIGSQLSTISGRGSAVYLDGATVSLRRLRIENNQPNPPSNVPLFFAQGAPGQLILENLVIAGNQVDELIEATSGVEVFAGYLSAANNSYVIGGGGATASPAVKASGSGTEVGVYSSILWDFAGFDVFGGAAVGVDCLITSSTVGVPPGAFAVSSSDPQFLDPTSGNLRVAPFSPAVDYCDLGAYPFPDAPDIDGQSRPADRPDNPNGSPGLALGTIDVGAFELQIGAIPPPGIFFGGFEAGDLSGWSTSVGG